MVQDNDDIIELTEVVFEDESENEDQGIIELTEIAPKDGDVNQVPGPDVQSVFEQDPLDENENGAVLETGAVLPGVSREAFEEALERVIEKKFSQTIEKILFEVMEKVVQKEIADIKASLQKDLDDIGRP